MNKLDHIQITLRMGIYEAAHLPPLKKSTTVCVEQGKLLEEKNKTERKIKASLKTKQYSF